MPGSVRLNPHINLPTVLPIYPSFISRLISAVTDGRDELIENMAIDMTKIDFERFLLCLIHRVSPLLPPAELPGAFESIQIENDADQLFNLIRM